MGTSTSKQNCVPDNADVALQNCVPDNEDVSLQMSQQARTSPERQVEFEEYTQDQSLYFDDKERRIDFVLVYNLDIRNTPLDEKRQVFENNLIEVGLQLEYQQLVATGLGFVKIHAPWEVLAHTAELMRLRKPMKSCYWDPTARRVKFGECQQGPAIKTSRITENLKKGIKNCMNFVFTHSDDLTLKGQKPYCAPFQQSREYLFDIPDRREEFFTPAQRSLMVDFILKRTYYSEGNDALAFGIKRLININVYRAAFPLHEGRAKDVGSPRWKLCQEWASLRRVLSVQPLDYIRWYFGVKIGLYFAWLGYYTYMLIPATVLGILCFFYGLAAYSTDIPSKEICQMGRKIIMCPRCISKVCKYWFLDEMCQLSQVSFSIENGSTIVFAVLMAFWTAVFLERWKRYSARITYQWDLTNVDTLEEHPRPEYLARLKRACNVKSKRNPVTGECEPYVPFWTTKFPVLFISFSTMLLLVSLAIASVLGVVLYRMAVSASLFIYAASRVVEYVPIIVAGTAATINLLFILLFDTLYEKTAFILTEYELHRTQTDFDNSLTLKLYLLKFVNYYSSIFYIAFIRGRELGHPGEKRLLFGYRREECGSGGCLIELTLQLVIIMVGKQIINAIIEKALPWLQMRYNIWTREKTLAKYSGPKETSSEVTRLEDDFNLPEMGSNGLFYEYLEMVLQFGFIALFAPAFPLAPLCGLVNNCFEVRLDASKFVRSLRRPVAQRVKGIGVWYHILDFISRWGVLTNAAIIAFTTDLIPKMFYYYNASPDRTLTGYINFTLSRFHSLDFDPEASPAPLLNPATNSPINVTECRYFDFRQPPSSPEKYTRTVIFWQILVAKLAFILVFYLVVAAAVMLLRWVIPDVPRDVYEKIQRERYLRNELAMEEEKRRHGLPEHSRDNVA